MLFVSDIHDSPSALRKLVAIGEEIVLLGDLVNLNDYRTGQGAVAEVVGHEFAARSGDARAVGDYRGMRRMWTELAESGRRDLRAEIGDALARQYQEAGKALQGGKGLAIHGNVDRPQLLTESLPGGFEYVHGQRVERSGLSFGFVGGGVETPLQAAGEITDDQMRELLDALGPVDVLCTHVPPAVPAARRDVVTGRIERGSVPVLDYLEKVQPRYHFYGDVHQPQATTWRVGHTRCLNAGYFRATGRFLRLRDGIVQVGSVG